MISKLFLKLAFVLAAASPFLAHADAPMSQGEVKKIDKDNGKLTIKHGPLANLNMPAMAMAFKVADPTVLDKLKPGEKIEFVVEKVNGALTVTKIVPAK